MTCGSAISFTCSTGGLASASPFSSRSDRLDSASAAALSFPFTYPISNVRSHSSSIHRFSRRPSCSFVLRYTSGWWSDFSRTGCGLPCRYCRQCFVASTIAISSRSLAL